MADVGQVAKLALEMENKAIVMSRAELEKLAVTGTVAGEKIKAALAGVTPIAQTVADRAKQVNATFTQFAQTQAPINGVTAAMERMRATLEQIRANAMASQVALNDPFQRAERSVISLTAAIERMRAANRQAQADAQASRIVARDPFQRPDAFVAANSIAPAVERANGNMRSFTLLTREAANAAGLLGRQGFMVANALHVAVEEFERIRAVQAATGTATAATASRWTTLRTAIASVNPLVLAAIAGMTAYAITSAIVRRRTEEETAALERQAEMVQFMNKVRGDRQAASRDAAAQQRDAERQVAAFRRGGEEALQLEADRQKALSATRAQYSALEGAQKNMTEENERQNITFQALLRLQLGAVAAERELANLRTRGQASIAADQMRVEALADYAELQRILTPVERARNARGAEYMAFLKAAGVDEAARNQKLREFMELLQEIDRLTEADRRKGIAGQLAETQRQIANDTRDAWLDAFNEIALGGANVFDTLVGLATQLADQAHRAAQAVADAFNAANQLRPGDEGFQVAGPSLGPVLASVVPIISTITSHFRAMRDAARETARALDAQVRAFRDIHSDLDRFVRDLGTRDNPLQQELDNIQDWYDEQREIIEKSFIGGRSDAAHNQAIANYLAALEKLNDAYAAATAAAEAAAEAERQRSLGDLQIRLAQARGNDQLALSLQRTQELADARDDEHRALLEQIFAAEDAARAMGKLTDNISDLRNVLDNLQEFEDRLKLGPQSILSPIQQLQEARRQFETMAALALSGDRSAAASLSGSGQSFLDASRGVFASSGGYVSDFQRVQDVIDQVQGRFAGELSLEEQSLAELKGQTKRIDEIAKRAEEQRDGQIAVLADGFTRTIERLDAVAGKVDELSVALVLADDRARA